MVTFDTCEFEVKIIDKIPPEIVDCTIDTICDTAIWGACNKQVRWTPPMVFDDNCKIIEAYTCDAEHDGVPIEVQSVDPQYCDSKDRLCRLLYTRLVESNW